MKTIWEGLQARLGLKRTRRRQTYALDENQLLALVTLAEKEQKSEQEMFTDLFDTAVNQRLNNVELMDRWQLLSRREKQVTELTCLGYTNRQIAGKLRVSENTVNTHVKNAMKKFNMHGKLEMMTALRGWDFSE